MTTTDILDGQVLRATQDRTAVQDLAQTGPAISQQMPKRPELDLSDPLLNMSAEILDDLERVRIANENRLRQLTRDVADADGAIRGFGLSLQHPAVAQLAALVEDLTAAEHDAELHLKRTLRKHPLGVWIKKTHGIGEKQGARLLAALGDPYWHPMYGRPCTVSELWAYCGYHVLFAGHDSEGIQQRLAGGVPAGSDSDQAVDDAHSELVGVAAFRRRGIKLNWSATAKMRAFLVAESICKAGGPYRNVYDMGRVKYQNAAHKVPCVRCGPSGHPAKQGSLLSKGHQHARALRLVAKEVLKDLWKESKRLHEEAG